MKTTKHLAALLLLLTFNSQLSTLYAIGTGFTYQGRLTDAGSLPNNVYDMSVTLWSTVGQVGGAVVLDNVPVTNGLFTVILNAGGEFGATAFDGNDRWLEISVRPGTSTGAYTTLLPRQPLTPTPYAIRAGDAGTLAGQNPSAFAPAAGSSSYVAKTGDTMTGTLDFLTSTASQGIHVARQAKTTQIYLNIADADYGFFDLGGGTTLRGGSGGGVGSTFGGKVGIGNNSPGSLLSVGSTSVRGTVEVNGATSGFGPRVSLFDNRPSGRGYSIYSGLSTVGNLDIYDETAGRVDLTISSAGNVGIGTPTPAYLLDVNGTMNCGFAQITASSPTLQFYSPGNEIFQLKQEGTSLGGASKFSVIENCCGTPRYLMSILYNGNVGIGTTNPATPLDVQGETRTCVLTITGGCDLAEPFQMSSKEMPKGAVVVIDEENPGRLKLSAHAYDTRVAGILSGANGVNSGILLKQEGFNDGGENVALSGRVYALADASFGAIKPGDLLTTSDTPGHCMKVTNHARAQGAIIGKAMSALKEGKGMVLVLVSLQ